MRRFTRESVNSSSPIPSPAGSYHSLVALGGGGGGKALTMTMTPWNLAHGQWSKNHGRLTSPPPLALSQ